MTKPCPPPAPRLSKRLRRTCARAFAAALLTLFVLSGARARAAVDVQLSPSAVAPQPVGTTVVWTASATDTNAGALEYRFTVESPDGDFAVVRDFDPSGSLKWTPSEREGTYKVKVTVKNTTTLEEAQRETSYAVSSRVSGSDPVVSTTANPLVALYSAPACDAGSMRVRFWRTGDLSSQVTSWKSCRPGVSMNFYVAGMLASTPYNLQHEVSADPAAPPTTGPIASFTTGAPGAGYFPAASVITPPAGDTAQPLLLHAYLRSGGVPAPPLFSATDLSGRLLWYFDEPILHATSPCEGGAMLVLTTARAFQDTLLKIDLAGGRVRETNITALSAQLAAMGHQNITHIHHDARCLPDGKTVVLANVERTMSDVQGPGPVTIMADFLLVLDEEWKVVWAWNSFDHLDVTRKAIFDSKLGPPYAVTAPTVNDWLHSNAVTYSPADGNLLLSMRHQDWVIKIDYGDGSGTGGVVWRLGKDGDFTIDSDDPYPWFSHQHDAEYEPGSSENITIFDNGNTRQVFPNSTPNSRGQSYKLDETTRTATLILNANLGGYSNAWGSAQKLADGNYHFMAGRHSGNIGRSIEVDPAGALTYILQSQPATYRSFRMRDLYTLGDSTSTANGEAQTISFDAVTDKTSGDPAFNVSATATSGLPVSFRVVSGPATVSGDTVTITGAGTVVLQADQYGNIKYDRAPSVKRSFVVKSNQTIMFEALANKTFGDPDFAVSATASSGLSVSFSADGTCTLTGATVHITGPGTCKITASQAGDSNFNAAAPVEREFTVAKAGQTITFAALSGKTFGDADFTVSAASSAGLAVSFAAAPADKCTVTGVSVHIVSAGNCTITASQAGNANYEAAQAVPRSFQIARAASTTTVTVADAVYDGLPHGGTAAVTGAGGLSQTPAVTYSGRDATVYGPSTTAPTNAGDYTATASFGGDNDREGSTDSKNFRITKAAQTITFAALTNKTFGDADFTVGATSSAGLAVSFNAAGKCAVTGATIHLTGAGLCTVTASQPGNGNYVPATDVPQSFQIAKAATTTSLSSSAPSSPVGQGVTFTAVVASAAAKPTGSVQFKADGVSLGAPVALDAAGVAALTTSALAAGSHVITAEYGGDSDFNTSGGALGGNLIVGSLLGFSQNLYSAAERAGSVSITVRRTGDTSQAASVDYSTDDGSAAAACSAVTGLALERCDYALAGGTLQFAAGEAEKTFVILLSDDSYVEGAETTLIRLASPSGAAALGAPAVSTLSIEDDAAESSGNPIDDDEAFVRQHYKDFLNREPDAEGLAHWTNQMRNCGSTNLEVCRVNVSAAFFLSIEFQQTGFLVERMHKAAYGDATGMSAFGGAHQIGVPAVRFSEFMPDTQQISRGVTVGRGNWQQLLETNKAAFALSFVQRPAFLTRYPAQTSATAFVNLLDSNAGGVLSPDERAALVGELSPNPADAALRASVLRKVAEDADLLSRETNRAFVLMQYFGYLRRDPNEAPESGLNHTGYDFWLRKLEQFGGDAVAAEMVKAFLNSDEYRQRFGR